MNTINCTKKVYFDHAMRNNKHKLLQLIIPKQNRWSWWKSTTEMWASKHS